MKIKASELRIILEYAHEYAKKTFKNYQIHNSIRGYSFTSEVESLTPALDAMLDLVRFLNSLDTLNQVLSIEVDESLETGM